MPTPDQIRIEKDRARPRIIALWWALQPLRSVTRFMQSGAHPDDEISGMLAALAFRDGINLSYACSTRGEGGQNDIGTETGPALGALRTREMERACDVLGMRMYWHCVDPTDSINDFGFSKSGEETLSRWGAARTLARFVEIVRTDRPDILCPTFLDVPGQHGHHRAMTQAAHDVMRAAADPAFASELPPWQIKKMYLPAWSGAGQSYDDDLPPPPATLTIDGSGRDPVSGWSWQRIGQQSRAFHRSQGMGRWVANDHVQDWPLHLAETHVPGPDTALQQGVPATLIDLSHLPGGEKMAQPLAEAQSALADALAAFPNINSVVGAALKAVQALRAAQELCPEALRGEVAHRLNAKDMQLRHVIQIALGVELRCSPVETFVSPGHSTALELETCVGDADDLQVAFDLPDGWSINDDHLHVHDTAQPSDPYPTRYDPHVAQQPACIADISVQGQTISLRIPFETCPVVLPAAMATVAPDAAVINLTRGVHLQPSRISEISPSHVAAHMVAPNLWQADIQDGTLTVTPPEDLTAGRYDIPLHVGTQPAETVARIQHPHIAPTAISTPAVLRVLALDVVIPDTKVGYIGAGNDRVNYWLAAMGVQVTDVSDEMLRDGSALACFDTLVIGILAMRFRTGLVHAMPQINAWVQAGGTLLTLYHRPWDHWDPDTVPPRRIEIGQPSLRWRVTNEAAPVRHLTSHAVLDTPNKIGPEDWSGWVKERGLYFAKSWDPAYVPLIELSDPGEVPLQGAWLVADTGAGRHIHTALNLHHQMEKLVPGAFRIMANCLAKV